MIKRIITALLIIAAVIPPLLLGGVYLEVLVGVIVAFGSYEIIKLSTNIGRMNKVFVFIYIALLTISVLIPSEYGILFLFGMVILILAVPVFAKNFNSEDAIFFIGVMTLFFAFANSFVNIYKINSLYVWFIIIATYGCDTGAYFVGVFFGKTKLIPDISPKNPGLLRKP